MITFPEIDPVIFSIGPIALRWYGMMYLVGFVSAYLLVKRRLGLSQYKNFLTSDNLSDILFVSVLGVIIGGRIGYVIFYGTLADWRDDPLWFIKIWEGGMSFHGGLLGFLLSLLYISKKINRHHFDILDLIVPFTAIGLGFGRLGNFINGELYGRVSDVPWAMVFPHSDGLARHPSQLYQAFFEGLVLFLILYIFTLKERTRYATSALFLISYGIFRVFVEFFREPDAHIGYIGAWFTMGQILSLPMIFFGIGLLIFAYKKPIYVSDINFTPSTKKQINKNKPIKNQKKKKAK